MAAAVTLTKVRRIPATGRIYMAFADGAILEFPDFQTIVDWANEADAPVPAVLDWLRRAGVRYYLARDPTAANPSIIEGKTLTLDLTLSTPLVVT